MAEKENLDNKEKTGVEGIADAVKDALKPIQTLSEALAISIIVFETSSKVPPNFSTPAAESVKAIFISSILALLKPKLLLSLSACATIKPNASLKV